SAYFPGSQLPGTGNTVSRMKSSPVLGAGRIALVTGASRGIGPLIARDIAAAGSHVVLSGRTVADLETGATELGAAGAAVSVRPADLTDPGAREALIDAVERPRGRIERAVH